MGQWAYNSQLGRHRMGGPGSWVMLPSPGVPNKRGGASQGAQPDRLRSPRRAKAPRSEVADYPPTKGAKATRSARATHLLLWGGCPARGRLGGGRGRGCAAQGKGVTNTCGSSQEQGAQVAQAVCGYRASGQKLSQLGPYNKGWPGPWVRHSSPGVPDNRGGASRGAQPSRLRSPKGVRAPRRRGPITRPRRGQKLHGALGQPTCCSGGVPSEGPAGGWTW